MQDQSRSRSGPLVRARSPFYVLFTTLSFPCIHIRRILYWSVVLLKPYLRLRGTIRRTRSSSRILAPHGHKAWVAIPTERPHCDVASPPAQMDVVAEASREDRKLLEVYAAQR